MDENRQTPEVEERNATLDEDIAPSLSADELQERILEDSGMNAFQKFCNRMDDARWTVAQRVTGALLGVAAGLSLFWDSLTGKPAPEQQGSFFSVPLIIAILLALVAPNVIEKQGMRRVPKLRTTMVIALALMIVIYFIIIGMRTGFKFTD